MTFIPWIDELRHQVEQATARSVSMLAKLQEGRSSVVSSLDRLIAELGRIADQKERAPESRLVERVLDAFRTRRYESLTVREQRFAAKQFPEVGAADMQDFLRSHPRNWPSFASECLRRWEAFEQHTDRNAYIRLLCAAPGEVTFLHQTMRAQDLLQSDGPARLAATIPALELGGARDHLQACGFEPAWSFTSNTVAQWAYLRVADPSMFARTWRSIEQDRVLEAMLLPPLPGTNESSWFSDAARPARVRRSLNAYATFVGALIRAAYSGGVESAHWNAFTEKLLRSSFGDPRIPPESKGWMRLKHRDPSAYQRFLEQLITEDLKIFFEVAMTDMRREEFWLGYLKSVRRTVSVLDRSLRHKLQRQLAGADERLVAALARTRTFRRRSDGGAQAFCLYFDKYVVVEFSEQGNAAYIYSRPVFEQQFAGDIYKNECVTHNALKSKPLALGRILHHGEHWEQTAYDRLASMGIYPD